MFITTFQPSSHHLCQFKHGTKWQVDGNTLHIRFCFSGTLQLQTISKMKSDPLNTHSQNRQPIGTLLLHAVMLLLCCLQGFLHQNNHVSPTFTLSIPHSAVFLLASGPDSSLKFNHLYLYHTWYIEILLLSTWSLV